MMPPWQTGVLESVIDESQVTRRFFIRVPQQEIFQFQAGQFVTLDLPIGEKPAQRWRSYSIASPPAPHNLFELLISLMPEGAGTHYLFNQLSPGSEIRFRGPQGKFLLPQLVDRPLFLICTGTGIAPFRSMLLQALEQQLPKHPIYLIFGCRRKADLLYFSEMEQLASTHNQFHYLPVLSRESWPGKTGYVHQVYEEICRQQNQETVQSAYFYLCGWKNMIHEARERIEKLGYSRKDIHLEIYG